MNRSVPLIRIFISSPSDVKDERLILLKVIGDIQSDPSFRGKVFIDPVAWDKPGLDTPLLATMEPQEAINQDLSKPSECDIVVVILWARMGTPLSENYVKPEGHRFKDPGGLPDDRFLSGTEWEFIDAFDASESTGLPLLVVYRRTEEKLLDDEAVDFDEELTQKRRVREFFDTFKNADGTIKQSYNIYRHPDEFREKIATHLRALLLKSLEAPRDVKSDTSIENMLSELGIVNTTHHRRSAIGLKLHEAGDNRPGIGVKDDLPDIAWCRVYGGQITIEDRLFNLQPFYIAKYPITYSQFQTFLESADGFDRDEWWHSLTEKFRKQEITKQRQLYSNFPRDSVSWYQAVAFTRWLNHRFSGKKFMPENASDKSFIVGQNLEIRLPTEWEWQHAATGGNPQSRYPWGEWNDCCANTSEASIGRPTAVGMYPAGASICGALDLAGNLWEWCLNEYFTLSVDDHNHRQKSLRGGAFDWDLSFATCKYRGSYPPFHELANYGFRVVCAPASNLSR